MRMLLELTNVSGLSESASPTDLTNSTQSTNATWPSDTTASYNNATTIFSYPNATKTTSLLTLQKTTSTKFLDVSKISRIIVYFSSFSVPHSGSSTLSTTAGTTTVDALCKSTCETH